MTDFQNLVIEPLNPIHDRTGFQCGVEALDRYLKKQAKQDIKRRISRVFVSTKEPTFNNIAIICLIGAYIIMVLRFVKLG